MSARKSNWNITVVEENNYMVSFDKPVTKEEATWQYETGDDNILEVSDVEFIDTIEVKSVR